MNLSRMLLFITLSCMKLTGYFRPYRSLGEDSFIYEKSYVCISTWLSMQLFRKSYREKMVSVARLPFFEGSFLDIEYTVSDTYLHA